MPRPGLCRRVCRFAAFLARLAPGFARVFGHHDRHRHRPKGQSGFTAIECALIAFLVAIGSSERARYVAEHDRRRLEGHPRRATSLTILKPMWRNVTPALVLLGLRQRRATPPVVQ